MKRLSILVILVGVGCGEPEEGDKRSNPLGKLMKSGEPDPEKTTETPTDTATETTTTTEHNPVDFPDTCVPELPAELKALIESTREENLEARDLAVQVERTRLGVTPLKPTTIIGRAYQGTNEFKPETDPFPESVVVAGDLTYDVRAKGYQLNHGKMDMETIYETAPGSGQYFIVDMISGDGVGGNGKEVIAYSVEYGLIGISEDGDLNGNSWHSWHVSPDNVIVRATQKVEEKVLQAITVCGCGGRTEVKVAEEGGIGYSDSESVSGDFAPPRYAVAIFMLPGTAEPKISEETFEASFKRSYVKQKFVPKKGYGCMDLSMETC